MTPHQVRLIAMPGAIGRVAMDLSASRALQTVPNPDLAAIDAVRIRHRLPERYFYLPNQLWRHKNHLLLLEALARLRARGERVVVAATGAAADSRNPDHPQRVFARARELGVEDMFCYLGMVPYDDVLPLARGALALVNPSLFEGWSTTVEEAKSLGVPMLLSDLAVHREQAGGVAGFFDPHDAHALARVMADAWQRLPPAGRRADAEAEALQAYRRSRSAFGDAFARLAVEVAGQARRP